MLEKCYYLLFVTVTLMHHHSSLISDSHLTTFYYSTIPIPLLFINLWLMLRFFASHWKITNHTHTFATQVPLSILFVCLLNITQYFLFYQRFECRYTCLFDLLFIAICLRYLRFLCWYVTHTDKHFALVYDNCTPSAENIFKISL